ncbi:hypothetical protein EIN_061210 [Entamoeba invadens IP1]|uniref:hypothetical protein n=1 Tax=Entamoeba invadens IP1 TaxID=370355 RepID=UPI0002C3E936|nr:hypothetical protein EIN_061210 [Entamoeba invadens IP1]ELP93556.1 hypothetical protein EIN_061210 [Entamoeba invadens IP1]|eukprot:XP_004260327.1 hypothetical protein EIN_061210 [Entamoeba invadens IP1]
MSIKLSELVFNIVSDIYSSPSEKDMQMIANVVEKIESADVAFRSQVEERMEKFMNKKITSQEMMNTLVLTNYVVQYSQVFRTQACELSFVKLLQQIGKMKKRYDQAEELELKVRELIAVWGSFYPNEMNEYAVLYKKYCSLHVINSLNQPTTFLPPEITKLIPHVEHNLRNITKALENGAGDLQAIHNRADKIRVKFQKQLEKCVKLSSRYDETEMKNAISIGNRLSEYIKSLDEEIQSISMSMKSKAVYGSVQENKIIRPQPVKISLTLLPPPSPSPKARNLVRRKCDMSPCSLTSAENSFEDLLSPSPTITPTFNDEVRDVKDNQNVFVFDEEIVSEKEKPGPVMSYL